MFQKVLDSEGNLIKRVDRELVCRVAGRDGRFYPPPELIKEFNLSGTEHYEIILQKLVKPDGLEVEIPEKE